MLKVILGASFQRSSNPICDTIGEASRSNGAFIVWRKTAKKRMVAKLHAIKAELRLRMHESVADVGAWLRKVVSGYYRYHAVPGNIDRLSVFGQRLRRLWWLMLRRRSQRPVPWDRLIPIFTRLRGAISDDRPYRVHWYRWPEGGATGGDGRRSQIICVVFREW
jgi:hypothetical protein